jgi:hypothetical protein
MASTSCRLQLKRKQAACRLRFPRSAKHKASYVTFLQSQAIKGAAVFLSHPPPGAPSKNKKRLKKNLQPPYLT